MLPLSARWLLAGICAMALAGVLISPAVASPPTVVGKSIHGSAVLPALPGTSASQALAGLLGTPYRTFADIVFVHDFAAGPVSLPLRR